MLSHDDACFVCISRPCAASACRPQSIACRQLSRRPGLASRHMPANNTGLRHIAFSRSHTEPAPASTVRHTNLLKPGEILLEVFVLRFETFLARSPCPVQPLTSLCRRRAGLCLICVYCYLSRSSSRTVTKIFCRPVPAGVLSSRFGRS